MNKLQKRLVASVLMISTLGAMSTTVQAEEASVDKVLARIVLNQGTRVMNEINVQLQQSIQQELSKFSIDQAVMWSNDSAEALASKESKTEKQTEKSSEE